MENQRHFMNYLKLFIFLAPLPFGCVGPVFAPLFYIIIIILSFLGLNLKQSPTSFLYANWLKRYLKIYFLFIIVQLIPLPVFLLKIISPATIRTLAKFSSPLPAFHSLSLIPADSFIAAMQFSAIVLFFWILWQINWQKKDWLTIINTMIFSAGLQALLGMIKLLLKNKYFFLFFYKDTNTDLLSRLTGTLGNVNHFSFFLEMIFPIALAMFFLKIDPFSGYMNIRERFVAAMNTDKATMGYLIVSILLGASIYLTGSRAGITTLILSIMIFSQLFFYIFQATAVKRKIRYIFIAFTLMAVLFGIQNTVKRFMNPGLENSGRFLRWPNTLKMVSHFPLFGTGIGTYRFAYYLYDTGEDPSWSTHAHNDVLEVIADSGIIGSVIFFLMTGTLVFSIMRMWIERRHPQVKIIGIGIITSLFAVIFHSFFDFSLRIPSNILYLVLILSIGLKIVTYKRDFREI